MNILYHILYPQGLGDDRFTYEGYKEAFEDFGHNVFPLTEKMDLARTIQSLKPDVFIEEGGFLFHDLEAKADVLRKFRQRGGQVVLHGAMSQELLASIVRDSIIDVYFSEIDPTGDFGNFPPRLFKKMHWLAASQRIHGQARPMSKYRCDIIYIGANLLKKREAFDTLLLPLIKNYHVKIYGFDWDFFDRRILHPLAKIERLISGTGLLSKLRLMRQVPVNLEGSAYASAKISINFHEKQPGNDFRTINARTFKIPASGGFEVCDYVPQIREFFGEDELVMPRNNKQWFEKIDYYLKNDNEREKIRARGTKRALREHTFYARVKEILTCL